MELTPVKGSSQVHSIGHDPDSKTLAVKFHNGGVYHYHDVSREKYDALMKAKSVGAHLHAHIKGQHKFEKQK